MKVTRDSINKGELLYGICCLSICPLRKKPDHQSEMISQALFGEVIKVIDRKNKFWIKIECVWDGVIAWADPRFFSNLNPKSFDKITHNHSVSLEFAHPIISDERSITISIGSTLAHYDGLSLKMPEGKFVFNGQAIDPNTNELTEDRIIKIGRKFLYTPFLWGGRSSFGIDGPGLTQVIFKILGKNIPRQAKDQALYGDAVDFVDQVRVGDLALFEDKHGHIHHAGLVMEDKQILHCSGRVRLDRLDHFGIYNTVSKKYTHKLRIVRRLLD